MYSHVMIGADDIDAAKKFYDATFAALGYPAGKIDPKGRVFYTNPKGMFAVQAPDGVKYTRAGAFTLNENRELVTNDGYQILDTSQRPITLPQGRVIVSETGAVSVEGKSVGTMGIYNGTFTKEGGNLFSAPDAIAADGVMVRQQALEGSNVNAVQSMIEMIQIGRAYELSQKAVQQQDDLSQRLIQSLSTKS